MKINWFSPLPPTQTGIAEYTAYVIPVLCNYAEVVLWTNSTNWSLEIEQYAKVCYYELTNIPWAKINQADLNVYHIGNHSGFHHAIWEINNQCPGLVVLHDFKLHHFFGGIYRVHPQGKNLYINQMMRYYGLTGKQAAEKFWSGSLTIEFMAENYPLTYLAIENSLGVITHTQEAFNTLNQENRWSVAYAPLPYFGVQQRNKNQDAKAINLPYRLIVFGHIATNRRIEALLEALATLDEKNSFHLDIYGKLWDENYVHSKILKLGLDNLVTLHSFVEEAELDLALANAHLAINLRYPTVGEASLSQLRIWSHSLPSLVTQVGWYSELSEDTVAFVRPDNEIEDIQQQLRNFIAQPKRFFEMGKNGLYLLEKEHSPESYAQAIVHFAHHARKFRCQATAHKLVKLVGRELSSWRETEILDIEAKKISEAIHFISC